MHNIAEDFDSETNPAGTVRGFITYLKKYKERKATNREPRTVNPEPE